MSIVTISHEMGAGGPEIGQKVAERLGLHYVDQELISNAALRYGVLEEKLSSLDESKPSLFERFDAETRRTITILQTALFEFAEKDRMVLMGRAGQWLLRGIPHVVRVRVCAPLETRVTRMMERLATDNRETVESEIQLSEEAHTAITKRHFNVNWRDPENYDVVLSTERLSVDECVDEVEGMMKRKCFQETAESRRLVENLSREWSVRSALRRDPRTTETAITVECNDEVVRLLGVVDTADEALAAGEVAGTVEGIRQVDNQLKSAASAGSRYRREG